MQVKNIVSTVLLLIAAITASAQYKVNSQNAEKILKERNEIFFRFQQSQIIKEKADIITKRISVDRLDEQSGYIYAYDNKEGYTYLREKGIEIELLHNPSELVNPTMFDGDRATYQWDEYPTYDAYVDMMYQFEADYPALCKVEQFGTTNDGRALLAARISDNAGSDEKEPEFFYTSTMHGDETTGYVLMLRLIDYLLTSYGDDDRITEMVDNMEIWINPNANPDGTYYTGNNSVNGAIRGNANGVDLNRNFPDPEEGPHPDSNEYQVETEAFMDFAGNRDFVMSANHHGGAEVINYPWDTWSQLHADDDWFRMVSHEYADTAQLYSPPGYMSGFNDGITNGYDWYEVAGGRQDYMNYFLHCREVTTELSDVKLLPESQLHDHWDYNYRSLLNYIEQASYGLQGVITEEGTDMPVGGAKVEIVGHDEVNSQVYSDTAFGAYYRPLKEGTYNITFSAPCYETVTMETVAVQDYQQTSLDVQLTLLGFNADFTTTSTNVSIGTEVLFEDASCGNITSWEWTFEGGTPETSTAQNPVVVYEEPGTYEVTLTISNDEEEHTTVKEDYITAAAEYLMDNTTVTTCQGLFYDDGGPEDNYSNNSDYVMTIYPATSGAMAEVAFQSFDVEEHDNCSYDWLKIYDGETTSAPQIGEAYCGNNSPGTVTAANAAGALTFEFHSDGSVTGAGWEALISCSDAAMPAADFEADVTQIVEGEEVAFNNLSQNANTYEWAFEGGDPATSSEENPVVAYDEPGNYFVKLAATNENGSDTELKEDYIEVGVNTAGSLSENTALKVYPNPVVDGRFMIEGRQRIQEIALLTITGKVIKTLTPDSKKAVVSTSGLTGVYLVRITSDKNVAYVTIQVM
jgi:PKD repeat protein